MKQKTSILCSTAVIALVTATGCGTQATQHTTTSSSANQTTTYPLKVTDGGDHKVTIAKQPKHIASVTVGTDEILSGLVPKKDIAMVTTLATDPTQSNIVSFAKGIPSIQTANAEQIIAVHPDLVLAASYTQAGVVNQLAQANIPTYEFASFNSEKDIENNIEEVGKLVNEQSKAKALVNQMTGQIVAIHKAVQRQKPVTILDDSSYGYVAGKGTTVNDMIVDAGAKNAAASMSSWAKITDEEVVKLNPDIIIYSSDDTGFGNKLLHNKSLQTVNAVKNHRVYAIKAADLGSTSQYFVNGVKDVAKVTYPSVHLPQ
jgi:iron complex transport system substrate-binding protein